MNLMVPLTRCSRGHCVRVASQRILRPRLKSALALGDVWALDQLWKELGFEGLARVFRKARYTTPGEHALRVMVFNRLCDPQSKLGVLRWLQTVSMPQVDVEALTHQHLLRSLDALILFSSVALPKICSN